jgi:hypothetical protein
VISPQLNDCGSSVLDGKRPHRKGRKERKALEFLASLASFAFFAVQFPLKPEEPLFVKNSACQGFQAGVPFTAENAECAETTGDFSAFSAISAVKSGKG